MTKFTNEITGELLTAMDIYTTIAQKLINKLILETDQPEKNKIKEGHYYEIQNAELLNEQEILSENWLFDVHGEHCMFKNLTTGQTLEVSLGDKVSVGNLDPYFFYNFIETTESFRHLIKYFRNPFTDMAVFFEEMERQKKMIHIEGVGYRKS